MGLKQSSAWGKQWEELVAKACVDGALKKRLMENPAAVLSEHGIATPPGVQVKVVENTDEIMYLTLPAKYSEELSELNLNTVVGGVKPVGKPRGDNW